MKHGRGRSVDKSRGKILEQRSRARECVPLDDACASTVVPAMENRRAACFP